jgi:hypothetical protein
VEHPDPAQPISQCLDLILQLCERGHASAAAVQFSDGGTLTGTFTTNDTFNSLLNYNITTSPNTGIGFNYTPGTSDPSSTSLPPIIVLNTPPTNPDILQVTFAGGLTATGAPILIGTFDSFEQGPDARRDITAGEAIVRTNSVPEPSTIALAGIAALAGLLGYLRQRRRA